MHVSLSIRESNCSQHSQVACCDNVFIKLLRLPTDTVALLSYLSNYLFPFFGSELRIYAGLKIVTFQTLVVSLGLVQLKHDQTITLRLNFPGHHYIIQRQCVMEVTSQWQRTSFPANSCIGRCTSTQDVVLD